MNMHFQGHEQLMLFYLLPEDIVANTQLRDFPRDPYIVLNHPTWLEVFHSDYFRHVLRDAWARLVWNDFGIRGSLEHYSRYDPFWILAHSYPLWIQTFRATGLTAERYFTLEHGEAQDIVAQMMEYFLNQSRFCEWRDAVNKHRAHEDYAPQRSSVKTDFYRSWYHTRVEVKVLDYTQAGEPSHSPFEDIDSRLFIDSFKKRLDEKNQLIVKLLLEGYTQAETAERLGFANHSGVCKRIKKIGAELIKYMND